MKRYDINSSEANEDVVIDKINTNDKADNEADIREGFKAFKEMKNKISEQHLKKFNESEDEVYDSKGKPVKIDKPMWKKANFNKPIDDYPDWHKNPSRMSILDWVVTLVICIIPIVNIIMFIIWSFFSNTVSNEKRNFAKANLIVIGVLITLSLISSIMLGGSIYNNLSKKTLNLTQEFQKELQSELNNELDVATDEYDDLMNPGK